MRRGDHLEQVRQPRITRGPLLFAEPVEQGPPRGVAVAQRGVDAAEHAQRARPIQGKPSSR